MRRQLRDFAPAICRYLAQRPAVMRFMSQYRQGEAIRELNIGYRYFTAI